jgi:hypothetical protein
MRTSNESLVNIEALRPIGGLALRLMAERGWRWLLAVGLGLFLAGLSGLLGVLSSVVREQRFAREGRQATATVRHVEKGWGRDLVYYTFTDEGGRSRRGSGALPREGKEPAAPGDRLEVVYLPGNGASRPAAMPGNPTGWLIALVPVALLAMGAVVLTRVARHGVRGARLIADGLLAEGTIEGEATRLNIGWRRLRVDRVRYTFDLPDGERHEGEDIVVGADFSGRLASARRVDVLYLPDDPGTSVLYRKHWRRDYEARRR